MKKKMLLVAMYPKDEVPYAQPYLDVFSNQNIDYRIIYWNRNVTKENEFNDKEIFFNLECPNGGNKVKKIFKMLSYAKFIRKEMRKEIYGKIVVLTTVPGIMTFDILLNKYKGKYIYDIRDYTNEKNPIYFFIENKIIDNSFKTIISSLGFKQFLPKNRDYQVAHNISNNEEQDVTNINPLTSEKLVIGFVGNVRYENENIKLVDSLKGNKQMTFDYWGNVNNDFSKENLIERSKRVKFHGSFSNKDKAKIYEKISFINAIYGNESLEVTTALPNRLYDALIFKKPILTSKGTFLGEIVEKNGIGIAIDLDKDNVKNKLDLYIENFDYEKFKDICNQLLTSYVEEQSEFERQICKFTKRT